MTLLEKELAACRVQWAQIAAYEGQKLDEKYLTKGGVSQTARHTAPFSDVPSLSLLQLAAAGYPPGKGGHKSYRGTSSSTGGTRSGHGRTLPAATTVSTSSIEMQVRRLENPGAFRPQPSPQQLPAPAQPLPQPRSEIVTPALRPTGSGSVSPIPGTVPPLETPGAIPVPTPSAAATTATAAMELAAPEPTAALQSPLQNELVPTPAATTATAQPLQADDATA